MRGLNRRCGSIVSLALSLPVFLGGCSSGGGVEFAFESGGTPAELWINGSYAGDTPMNLTLEEVRSHFVSDLQEVSASVADGAQSIIFDEAENRLHAQKSLMLFLKGAL